MLRNQASRVLARAVRTYATEATAQDFQLLLTVPYAAIFNKKPVKQVNVPTISGELGFLSQHVPVIEQLVPGVVEVIFEGAESEKFFVSGGFAAMQPDNLLSITAVEAFKPEDFSPESVKSLLAEAQKNVSLADEAVAAEAAIQVEVLEALQGLKA